MRNLLFVLLLFLFVGCNNYNKSEIIEGDLYYSCLRLGSFYGQPDSLLTNYYELKDSLGFEGVLKEDSASAKYLKLLESNDLLISPYVYIRTKNRKSILLYLKPEDYEKLNHFKYKDLIENKQKVRIVAKVDSLIENMFVCKNLISVEVIEGETLPHRSKFKIEDYR